MKPENGRMKGDLKQRTKEFALKTVRLYSSLLKRRDAQVIGDQLLRSGTSVGAHFRGGATSEIKSRFCRKIEGGMQELEEMIYWLELLEEAGTLPARAFAAP
jgi:four helix bundle protein